MYILNLECIMNKHALTKFIKKKIFTYKENYGNYITINDTVYQRDKIICYQKLDMYYL